MTDGDEYERLPLRGRWSYWWLQRPWWMRGAVAGLVFGALMFLFSWASDDDSNPAGEVVGAAVSAVLFAIAMSLYIRSQER